MIFNILLTIIAICVTYYVVYVLFQAYHAQMSSLRQDDLVINDRNEIVSGTVSSHYRTIIKRLRPQPTWYDRENRL